VEDDEVGAEGDCGDHEEPQALVGDVAALAAERPQAVPDVVVGDRDEERAGGGQQVVEPAADEDREDGEVDEVAARSDGAELPQLSQL
jgi:hypothetical protein